MGHLRSLRSRIVARVVMASQEGPLYHLAPLAAWGAAKHANTPYTPATYEQARSAAAACLECAPRGRADAPAARNRGDMRGL